MFSISCYLTVSHEYMILRYCENIRLSPDCIDSTNIRNSIAPNRLRYLERMIWIASSCQSKSKCKVSYKTELEWLSPIRHPSKSRNIAVFSSRLVTFRKMEWQRLSISHVNFKSLLHGLHSWKWQVKWLLLQIEYEIVGHGDQKCGYHCSNEREINDAKVNQVWRAFDFLVQFIVHVPWMQSRWSYWNKFFHQRLDLSLQTIWIFMNFYESTWSQAFFLDKLDVHLLNSTNSSNRLINFKVFGISK